MLAHGLLMTADSCCLCAACCLLCVQAMEGALVGVEVAHGESTRRLSLTLNSALAEAEGSLQVMCQSHKGCHLPCHHVTHHLHGNMDHT